MSNDMRIALKEAGEVAVLMAIVLGMDLVMRLVVW
jgi:hypothetical protein